MDHLIVCRILGLTREVLPVVVIGGAEPQDGDGREPLAVGEGLLGGGHALRHNAVGAVKPRDLMEEIKCKICARVCFNFFYLIIWLFIVLSLLQSNPLGKSVSLKECPLTEPKLSEYISEGTSKMFPKCTTLEVGIPRHHVYNTYST